MCRRRWSNGTRTVNCAVLDEEYVLTNAPIVVSV
jgi:hypothetical protein